MSSASVDGISESSQRDGYALYFWLVLPPFVEVRIPAVGDQIVDDGLSSRIRADAVERLDSEETNLVEGSVQGPSEGLL